MHVGLTQQVTKHLQMCVYKIGGSIYPMMEVLVELDLKEKVGLERAEKGSIALAKGSPVPQTDRMGKSYFI